MTGSLLLIPDGELKQKGVMPVEIDVRPSTQDHASRSGGQKGVLRRARAVDHPLISLVACRSIGRSINRSIDRSAAAAAGRGQGSIAIGSWFFQPRIYRACEKMCRATLRVGDIGAGDIGAGDIGHGWCIRGPLHEQQL